MLLHVHVRMLQHDWLIQHLESKPDEPTNSSVPNPVPTTSVDAPNSQLQSEAQQQT